MLLSCPGCLAKLEVDDEGYKEKVLLQCPECLYVFLSGPDREVQEKPADQGEVGEATMLTSDYSPESDAREFQWNVPGASVTVIEGDKQGVHRRLTGELVVIGRKGADLDIDDKAVSRRHCELSLGEDGWRIKDLESLNGTLVNGEKITEAGLHHLDEIRVGKTRILFAEAEAPEGSPITDVREDEESGLDVTKVDDKTKDKELELPKGREFIIEYMSGPKKARSEKLTSGRVIIGRGDEADVEIDDQGVSRKHAMIEILSRDQSYISDLASQNGTWLNGMKIRTTKLIHGDRIRVGNTVLKFVVQDVPE